MKQLSLICYLRGSNIVFTWFAQSLSIRWIREFGDYSLIRGQFVGFANSRKIRWFVGSSLDSWIRGQFVDSWAIRWIRWFASSSLDSWIRGKFVDSWAIRWIREFAENSLIRGQFVGFVHSGTIRWFVGNSFHSFDSLFNEWFVAANPTNELIRKKRQFASLWFHLRLVTFSLLLFHWLLQ